MQVMPRPGASGGAFSFGELMLVRLLKSGLIIIAGLLLAACEQPPTPIVMSEAEATRRALPAEVRSATLPAASTLSPLTASTEVLRVVVHGWQGLDPVRFGDVASAQVQALLYESLLAYDDDGALQPLLVEALPVPSPDGLAWTVSLRAGILWHDGTPVDGTQVVAHLNHLLTMNNEAPLPMAVFILQQTVAAVDVAGMNLTFRLHEPFADFPHVLASAALALVHENGAGTGPFVLQDDDEASNDLQFMPNSAYHGDNPLAGGVMVTLLDSEISDLVVPDADVFVGAGLPPAQVPAGLVGVPGLPQQQWLLLDTARSPFNRTAAQQAFVASLDDPTAAYELFANAQLPDGFDLVVVNSLAEDVGAAVAERFATGPVNVTVLPVDWEQLRRGNVAGDGSPGAYLLAWDSDWIGQWWTSWLSGTGDAAVTMSGVLLEAEPTMIYQREGLVGLGRMPDGLPRIIAQTHVQTQPAEDSP